MKPRVRRPTSQNQCFQGAKTTFRLHERQKASCEGPKCIIFHHNNEALEKTIKNKPFSTPRTRRRGAAHPRKRIPLHGFGGRSVAPRTRRGEKRAPLRNAREPSRYRAWPNAQNHRKVSRSSTRNSHTLPRKSTTRTPFSPKRMPKR